MGYDVERVVEFPRLAETHCAICQGVLEDAVELECEHVFCFACIRRVPQRKCPLDRLEFKTADFRKPSRAFMNELARVKIKCEFHERGCEQIVELGNLDEHVRYCRYKPRDFRYPSRANVPPRSRLNQMPRMSRPYPAQPDDGGVMEASAGWMNVALAVASFFVLAYFGIKRF